MRNFKFYLLVLPCVWILLLCSCVYEPHEMGGVPVTPEMLESVSRSLAAEKTGEPESQSAATDIPQEESGSAMVSDTEISASDIVYWTENGTVYHLDPQCSTLRHSEHILSGSIDEAMSAKKERVCKSCS